MIAYKWRDVFYTQDHARIKSIYLQKRGLEKINGARMYIKSRLCHSLIDIYRVLYIQIAEMCRRESTLS